jgi:death-on-curing protein
MNAPLKIGQPRFLTKDEVLSLHRASIDMYGGADGVLDDGALESALAQPRQSFGGEFAHEFPFGMAAAYGYHLAMNHPFRDGNKRTAFAAVVVFLRMNGWNFELPDEHAADLMLEMIAKHRDKAWLAEKLAGSSKARPSLELRDFFATLNPVSHFAQIEAFNRGLKVGKAGEGSMTVEEAQRAIPILAHLMARVRALQGSGSIVEAQILGAQALLLIDLYRLAEDDGYEW